MAKRGQLETGLEVFGVLWVVAIVALGVSILPSSNSDARVLVAVVFTACIVAGLSAVVLMHRGRWRWSGALLMMTVATPSGFGAYVNVFALLVGLWLVLAGGEMARRRGPRGGTDRDQLGSPGERAAMRSAAN